MTSEIWSIISAISGALSLVLAIYIYLRSRTNRINEIAKTQILKDRLANLHSNLTSSLYSIDAIVQLSKQESATVDMLQNLARIARGQLYVSIKQLERERGFLKSWRFGQMIESDEEINAVQPEKDVTKPETK